MSYDLIIKWKLMDFRSLKETKKKSWTHLENWFITVIVSEKLAPAISMVLCANKAISQGKPTLKYILIKVREVRGKTKWTFTAFTCFPNFMSLSELFLKMYTSSGCTGLFLSYFDYLEVKSETKAVGNHSLIQWCWTKVKIVSHELVLQHLVKMTRFKFLSHMWHRLDMCYVSVNRGEAGEYAVFFSMCSMF